VESDPASNGNTVGGSSPRRNLLAPCLDHCRRGLLRETGPSRRLDRPLRSLSQLSPQGHQLDSWPRQPDSGVGPASGRPGQAPGRINFFLSHLCLCPCWHRCLRLQLIAERLKVPLTKQEQPRAARPTEPRDSYASRIRIPHSSPSHEATHTWLSGSASRRASPSARNEDETLLHAKNTYMFRPRQPQ
jgi:hypothetical protein